LDEFRPQDIRAALLPGRRECHKKMLDEARAGDTLSCE
jgi:hypothetical protein